MDDQTPAETPVEVAATGKQKNNSRFWILLGLCLMLAFAGFKSWPTGTIAGIGAKLNGNTQKIVVLNSPKIIAAATKQIMSNTELSPDQVSQVSQKLAGNMQKLIESYHAQGYIVLNSNALLTYPAEIDITANFAEQLGVKID